ncbi:hypothetical protein CHS0354_024995 [Potamilus streckersoni]|uniref:Uncharacterized protein n=1 Tax=Potamilus streckersoni TaxID=2493646 RepID=A0AAE0T374_9BIVA|nr:hypothetical protein CHS0354_024995 [Potamilus streckersoni]
MSNMTEKNKNKERNETPKPYKKTSATGFETVWVREVTEQIQADKRALVDLDLTDQLTFVLRRGLDDLTLNLKRNCEIDPNADIYVLQKLNDDRSLIARSNELESDAVAYYQDRENGEYMTVRGVKRANHKLDFVIVSELL